MKTRHLPFTLVVLGLAFTLPTEAALPGYQQVVLDQAPYSFHRFDEESGTTATDISGNSRNGTYVNSPTLNLPGAGGTGSDNAVGFNGSNQRMTFNANTLGTSLANVTFEAVFSTTTTTVAQTLFGTVNTGTTMAAFFTLNANSDGNFAAGSHRLFMRNANGHELRGTFSNSDLTNGDFNHLMITTDLSAAYADRYKIYVNGVAQTVSISNAGTIALSATSGTFGNFTNPLAVGALNNRGTIALFFNGQIDEFAIYDKTLAAEDAAAHFAAVSSLGTISPRITAFSYDPADGSAEATIEGDPNTRFKLVEAADLDFSTPDQDPVPLQSATVGTLFDGMYVTTDENGVATVQFNLGTGPATFIRAEEAGAITLANFDFEADGQGFTPSGDWAWGTPASDNGETNGKVIGGNGGSNGAWATALGDGGEPINGGITPDTVSVLRSPDIDLTGVSGARLEFAAAVDAFDGDTLEVRVLDAADDNTLLGTLIPFPDGFPANPAWQDLGPFDLPEDADDKTIYLEFRFVGTDDNYLGFYLDDVKISF